MSAAAVPEIPDSASASPNARRKRSPAAWWQSGWFLIPVLVALVFLVRLPALSRPDELNPDESQMLAQAMRYARDMVPWRSVDGTTGGPLNSWLLLGIHRLGFPLNHTTAHWLAAALVASLVAFTFATIRRMSDPAVALAAAATALAFVVGAQENDFIHYSSELLPALICAAVVFCCAARITQHAPHVVQDCFTGFLIGLLPWTKLQVAPQAAVLYLWLAYQILSAVKTPGAPGTRKWLRFAAFSLCVALPSLAMFCILARAGALQDFWISYIVANAAYASSEGGPSVVGKLYALVTLWQVRTLFLGLIIFSLTAMLFLRRHWGKCPDPIRKFLALAVLVGGAALFATLAPRYAFAHQQMLLFQPLCLAAGAVLAAWWSLPPAGDERRRQCRIVLGIYALCLLVLPVSSLHEAMLEARAIYERRAVAGETSSAKVARKIRTLCPDAHSMAIWGWAPALHVQSQIPPGTRHAICHFLIDPNPAREHLRASFLADLERERPPLIVDAMADGMFRWVWATPPRVDRFPALYQYMKANYILADTYQVTAGSQPVLFFLSREYVQQHPPVGGQR